ncbi:MAG: phosphate acyltransferase PlsX [Bordetella sp.]|nr:MAG: phosphate acyltransferase PlsX [Bordetella sp.]
MIRIAVDCMGGDFGLTATIPAAVNFIKKYADTKILLVGVRSLIEKELKKLSVLPCKQITIISAHEVIQMDDSIDTALRHKRNSSMHLAVQAVKKGDADACLSAGNTGAWMAISRYVLKTLDGIDRPAIATSIPNSTGFATTMLDLGANSDCSSEHLLQFAIMGSALSQIVNHRKNPSIGLLNIGEEIIKGNEVIKTAANLLRASPLNFYGNVEGDDIFKGSVDVIICNGFVGNVALKSIEGLAKMLSELLREEFKKNYYTKIISLIASPILRRFKYRVDNRRYNGAALLGLRGIVIKSHGSADAYTFGFALQRTRDAILSKLLERITQIISKINQQANINKIQEIVHQD